MNRTKSLAFYIALSLGLLAGSGCNPALNSNTGDSSADPLGLGGPTDATSADQAQQDGAAAAQTQTGKSPVLPITLYAITPAKGSVDGGTVVSLQGPGLTAGTTVTFDGQPAVSVQLVNPGLLTATTPAHVQGPVEVAVTNEQGGEQQVENGFTYSATVSARPPQISVTSLVPVAGPPEGGTYVTIRGTGFESGMAVLFDQSAALSVNVVNDRLITVMTPPHPEGQVNVVIETLKGASFLLVNGFEYSSGLPANDGTDTDGDGLTDYQEVAGWEIWIDPFGLGLGADTFGNVTRYVVRSDPLKVDTDDDGLDDFTESLIGSDPEAKDTDGDGLTDGEERLRWKTNPITVDTDADCRGPDGNLAPNDLLFDGEELYTVADLAKPTGQRTLKPNATSPSLADTDGDGYTDFEELGSTVKSPVIADLPQVKFEIVDKVAVRLHVEYADSIGTESTYGTELSASTTQTNGQTDIVSTTESWDVGGEFGWSGEGPVLTVGGSYGTEQTTGTEITTETAQECASALSESQSQSRERSVTQSSGSISLGLRAINNGNIVYTLNDLNITVRQFKPREGAYQTLTSLVPPTGAESAVLAPGDSTSVIPLSDNTLDAGLIKEFLANPSALLLEPTSYGLLNKDGTNFAFQTQETLGRTALVVIDYGQGVVEKHRIATNINRNSDSSLAGITLGEAMNELGLDYETAVNNDGGPANGLRRMARIGDFGESAFGSAAPSLNDPPYPTGKGPGPRTFRTFWVPMYARGNPALPPINPVVSIDEFVLQARDEVRLVYMHDDDRDGLYDRQETALGSSDADTDNDHDNLSDWYETRVGWTVTVQGQSPPPPYQVFPNPLLADADGDGLNDAQEQQLGTDPNNADTDDDTIPDNLDPYPLTRAKILYVNAANVSGAHNGASWSTAYTKIDSALNLAVANNSDADASNDVRQIWVARGTYYAPQTGLSMVTNVSVFGGFNGTETLRTQRNPDPFTNDTHIAASTGNSGRTLSAQQVANARLDGFIVENGHGINNPGLDVWQASNFTFSNLLFQNHVSLFANISAGVGSMSSSDASFENCTFSNNSSEAFTGGLRIQTSAVRFTSCSFLANTGTVPAASTDGGGGAVAANDCSLITFENCVFRLNQMICPSASDSTTTRHGGAVRLVNVAESRLVNCLFQDNQVTITGTTDKATGDNRAGGALSLEASGLHSLVGCVFFRNLAPKVGGGLYIRSTGVSSGPRVRAVNCSFARNQATAYSSAYASGSAVFVDYPSVSKTELLNCLLWGNIVNDATYRNTELEQINQFDNQPRVVGNNCCIQNLGVPTSSSTLVAISGLGNLGQDPQFINLSGGNLQLSANSPCIDAGNTLLDTDISEPGTQPLPALDIRGGSRIVDGDGNGLADVDIGAYEHQAD